MNETNYKLVYHVFIQWLVEEDLLDEWLRCVLYNNVVPEDDLSGIHPLSLISGIFDWGLCEDIIKVHWYTVHSKWEEFYRVNEKYFLSMSKEAELIEERMKEGV